MRRIRKFLPVLGDIAWGAALIFGAFYLAGLGWSLAQAVVLHGFMCGVD